MGLGSSRDTWGLPVLCLDCSGSWRWCVGYLCSGDVGSRMVAGGDASMWVVIVVVTWQHWGAVANRACRCRLTVLGAGELAA